MLLHLINSFCKPHLLYGIEALSLFASYLHKLERTWTVFWKVFKVQSDNNNNNNNNNNAICIAQIRRKQQMGCGQCPKIKAFSLALNVSIDMSVDRKSFGRLFHTEGPWTEKPRSP